MGMYGCGQRSRAKWVMAAMAFGGRGWGRDFGEGWGGRSSRGGPGGRGGRGRVFGSGELRLVLLKLINDGTSHGYELIKAIEELTGGTYAPSPGVVYPTLSLLLDEGVIEEWGEGSAKARRQLMVTEEGTKELAKRAEEADALIERLKALGEEGERHRAPPIARATGNLFTALRSRARAEGFDKETVHQIAAILDEAAQRIEKL